MRKLILILFLFCSANFCLADENDSLLNYENQNFNTEIITINKDCERIDGRIDDWYTNFAIGSGVFLVLLGSIITIQWFNNRGTARKQAQKELKSMKSEIEQAQQNLDDLNEQINELQTAFRLLNQRL